MPEGGGGSPRGVGKQVGDEERWSTMRASVAEVDDAVLGKKTKTTSGKKRTPALCLLLGLQLRRGGDVDVAALLLASPARTSPWWCSSG